MSTTPRGIDRLLAVARDGGRVDDAVALAVLPRCPADALLETAEALTLEGYGRNVSYSRKVFIPLTRLCRDVCRYCTFAAVPRRRPAPARRGPRPMGSKEGGAGLGRWRRRRTSRAAGGSLVSSSRAPAERGVRKVVRENRAAQSRVKG